MPVITQAHIKERLSLAYVHAVAGRAGVNVAHSIHDYGIDGILTPVDKIGSSYAESGFILQFQLKATTRWNISGSDVVYDLEAGAYNNMVGRHPSAVPMVLILMCMPHDEELWLRSNDKVLLLKNSCYWLWLTSEVSQGALNVADRAISFLRPPNVPSTETVIGHVIVLQTREIPADLLHEGSREITIEGTSVERGQIAVRVRLSAPQTVR